MTDDEKFQEEIQDLEKKLTIAWRTKEGAEGILLASGAKGKMRIEAQNQVTDCNKKLQYLMRELMRLKKLGDFEGSQMDILHALIPNRPKRTYLTIDVSMKIFELQEKIDIEMKMLEASEKLNLLYDSCKELSDKKARHKAQETLKDSIEKINLLKIAMNKYLSFGKDQLETNESKLDLKIKRKPSTKRTLSTGKLKLHIIGAVGLPNSIVDATKAEVYVIAKIDGIIKAKTKIKTKSTAPTWEEDFEIELYRAAEIEFCVYDCDNLCAILFFRLQDLAHQRLVEEWHDLEPNGQLRLRLQFERAIRKQKTYLKVIRQKHVQKRKIYESKGHNFIARNTYQVFKCAVCHEFLLGPASYQCEICNYTCHHKCYTSPLVAKCIGISKANFEEGQDNDEKLKSQAIKYRIPHRFSEVSVLKPTWCGHCGSILSVGRHTGKKCADCQIICHERCSLLMPNQCGLTLEMANCLSQLGDTYIDILKKRQISLFQNLQFQEETEMKLHSKMAISNVLFKTSTKKASMDDYQMLSVIGKGNFGKVILAEEKNSQRLVAIKVLKKEFVLENDEIESVRSEKRVFMAVLDHPFLVNLYSCFQTENHIYFVMEYIAGGDLMLHIQRKQFSEERAQFYAAEVLLALEFLHSKDIIYRDLKLDNILLGFDGHVKLADYGLCKDNMLKGMSTNTFCGTPEFMAPEIILEDKYTYAVDWWAFGVLLYEMLSGQSPFKGEDEEEIFEAILEEEIHYPLQISITAKNLIQKLLVKEPANRLGTQNDAADIKSHIYFKNIDWNKLLKKEISSSFLPHLAFATDVSNFDQEFTSEPPTLTPTESIIRAIDQEEFRDFTILGSTNE